MKKFCLLLVLLYSYPGYAAPVDDLISYLRSLSPAERAETTLVVMDMQYVSEEDPNPHLRTVFEFSRDFKPGEWRFFPDFGGYTVENFDGKLHGIYGSHEMHSDIKRLVLFADENGFSIVNVNYFFNSSAVSPEAMGIFTGKQLELLIQRQSGQISELQYESKFIELYSFYSNTPPGELTGTPSKIIPDEVKNGENYKYVVKYENSAFNSTDFNVPQRSDTSRYVITGCSSDDCVLKSVESALGQDKEIIVSSDTVTPGLVGHRRTDWNTRFQSELSEERLRIFGDKERFGHRAACCCVQ